MYAPNINRKADLYARAGYEEPPDADAWNAFGSDVKFRDPQNNEIKLGNVPFGPTSIVNTRKYEPPPVYYRRQVECETRK